MLFESRLGLAVNVWQILGQPLKGVKKEYNVCAKTGEKMESYKKFNSIDKGQKEWKMKNRN